MSSKKAYWFITISILLSYGWILFFYAYPSKKYDFKACLLKNTTNIPCPICGTTRSVLSILSGDLQSAFYFNPIGIVFIVFLFFISGWLLYDVFASKKSLYSFIVKNQHLFTQKKFLIVFFGLIVINWVFLIIKGI